MLQYLDVCSTACDVERSGRRCPRRSRSSGRTCLTLCKTNRAGKKQEDSMLKAGMCSTTFRRLDLRQVVDLAEQGGLEAIEWGGDVHVPHGDLATARYARSMTADAGLLVSSYGSYYRILDEEGRPDALEPVLDTALELGTNTVRIWPGARSSANADEAYMKIFMEQLRSSLDMAAEQGVRFALEFHVNTLADSNSAVYRLLLEMNHPALFVCWHPAYWVADRPYRLQGLEAMGSHVLNLHVFHCLFKPFAGTWGDNIERRPLAEAFSDWRRYFSVPLAEGDNYALLEFVRNDDPKQFLEDAGTLRRLLGRGRSGVPLAEGSGEDRLETVFP